MFAKDNLIISFNFVQTEHTQQCIFTKQTITQRLNVQIFIQKPYRMRAYVYTNIVKTRASNEKQKS